MKKKALKPVTKSNLITYAMLAIAFILVEVLLATGNMSNMFRACWFHSAFIRFWQYP